MENIIKKDNRLYTKNLVPGESVYNEKLIKFEGIEYRYWDPFRSKLSAAILNGLHDLPLKKTRKSYISELPQVLLPLTFPILLKMGEFTV